MNRIAYYALACTAVFAPAASAQGGVSVGGFSTEGSVGLTRAEYDGLARALGALLTANVAGRTGGAVVSLTPPAGRSGRVDVAAARTAAKTAGAKLLVIGSLLDQYGDIHVEARVIDASTGEPVAVVRGGTAFNKREQLAEALGELADRLAEQPALGGRRSGEPAAGIPVETLIQYGTGLRAEDAGDRNGAAAGYRAALKSTPGFTPAAEALRRVGG